MAPENEVSQVTHTAISDNALVPLYAYNFLKTYICTIGMGYISQYEKKCQNPACTTGLQNKMVYSVGQTVMSSVIFLSGIV